MIKISFWGIAWGILLIVLGFIFLLGQFLNFNVWVYIWPLFILITGAAFFAGMLLGGRSAGGLAVPGSVFVTIGLILFVQNLFDVWGAWYSWGFIISGVGIGLFLFGIWSDLPDLRRVGRVLIVVGLILFVILVVFFELTGPLFALRDPGELFWPVMLILAGLYLLVAKPLLRQANGPVNRSVLAFSPAAVLSDKDTTTVVLAEPDQKTGVRRVKFRCLGDLTVIQGEREGLEVEANQSIRERIRAEFRGDELDIRFDDGGWWWINPLNWGSGQAHYILYMSEIESITAAGLGNVLIPELSASHLRLVLSGAGNLIVNKLTANELGVHQAGMGNIQVGGQADRQSIDLTGAGSYQARMLESKIAHVRLSGLGNATVAVLEDLNAVISGAGNIEYYGNPRVSQNVTGLGNIRKVGS